MNKVAYIAPPRTGSTFFGRYIPQELFCSGNVNESRKFVENIGYVSEYHRTVDNYAECDHDHIWITTIRNPLNMAISYFHGLNQQGYVEDFILNRFVSFPSYYLKNTGPENYQVILDIADISGSLMMLSDVIDIDGTLPNIEINKSRTSLIPDDVISEFTQKNEKEFEIYYDFLNEFIDRKMRLLEKIRS